jgi:signal transduction histidine kinase
VVAITVALAGAYVAAAVGLHHDPGWNVVPNAGTYFANTIVAYAVARYVRKTGDRLDDARAEAVERADALATERERLRHARMLHDRVLQTLESLTRGDWVSDPDLRTHIAAEAAWLRGLVEGHAMEADGELSTELQRLIRDKAMLGVQVELNASGLREQHTLGKALSPQCTTALVDAAGEALTNVAKHAGTSYALMRVNVAGDRLSVSILDHGRGFDPAAVPAGLGLRESICGRLAEIGGTARVESSPGHGTFVELVIPWHEPDAGQPVPAMGSRARAKHPREG